MFSRKTLKSSLTILALAAASLTQAACAPQAARDQVALRLASPAWMVQRTIATEPFLLTAFERMHERGETANIYIEGDGATEITDTVLSLDPTPVNPVALHLSAMDKSDNVAYLARPCQYTGMTDSEESCDKTYWQHKSFAPEVLSSYNAALDDIRGRYGITDFNLIGYSGGGAIAAILAAQREDVKSLRTVAGNLDHKTKNTYFNIPLWEDSLNAIDFAADLKDVPQVHLIGGQDTTIHPAILHSYLQAIGSSSCVDYALIQEGEHARGWVDIWPELYHDFTPACKSAPAPTLESYDDLPEPIFYPRMLGDKK